MVDKRTMKKITKEEAIEIVQEEGANIYNIIDADDDVKFEAVKQNGFAIILIENPTYQMKVQAAISGYIKIIDEFSDEIKISLLKMYPEAIEFIKNPTQEMQLISVQQSGVHIQFIKNPSEDVQLAAVKQRPFAINYIDDPTNNVSVYVELKLDRFIKQ